MIPISVLSVVGCQLICPGCLDSLFVFVLPLFRSTFCGPVDTPEIFLHNFCHDFRVEVPHFSFCCIFSARCQRATLKPSSLQKSKGRSRYKSLCSSSAPHLQAKPSLELSHQAPPCFTHGTVRCQEPLFLAVTPNSAGILLEACIPPPFNKLGFVG